MSSKFAPQINEIYPQVVKWRRELHRHPELSFNEHATAEFVFSALNSFGNFEVTRPTPTSVMARLHGANPGRVLALRADMDALPLTEQNECDYVSQNVGVMHACGHDGHTAALLGVAKILAQCQADFNGEIRCLFQHAEEVPPGGAQQMVDAGVLDGVDAIVGIHLWSTMPIGKVGVIAGPMMAAPDNFEITIGGKGGHGGFPHQTIDSIAIAAQLVGNLQHIVARNCDPLESAVISVTKIEGGTTHNIIAATTKLLGTVRSFNPELRAMLPQLMERVINGITSAHGASYTFQYIHGYQPVVNHPLIAELLEEVVIQDLGSDWLEKMRPNMAAEDFSAYLAKVPGCFVFVGAGNSRQGIVYPHHHPLFNIDEESLRISLQVFLGVVQRFLA